jgi:hypothetical protein
MKQVEWRLARDCGVLVGPLELLWNHSTADTPTIKGSEHINSRPQETLEAAQYEQDYSSRLMET